jgi:hypothetical protein
VTAENQGGRGNLVVVRGVFLVVGRLIRIHHMALTLLHRVGVGVSLVHFGLLVMVHRLLLVSLSVAPVQVGILLVSLSQIVLMTIVHLHTLQ